MPSHHETFWQFDRYAVIGHNAQRPFPKLTYGELKKTGKTVYPIDESTSTIEGDRTYRDLSQLPGPVQAVVIEVPKTETFDWCRRVIDHGVKDIWLHMNTDSPEALALAAQHGVQLRTGTCAVMYLHRGFSPHAVHRWIQRLRGKY